MKKFFAVCGVVLATLVAGALENVNFISRPLTAGKASLTENGFILAEILGRANFSPELRLPIQLLYNSTSEKSGIFGFGWRSPQLESSAYYDKDGVLWMTPWGEEIKFFPKDADQPANAVKIELYEEAQKGRGFFAPYSEWEANTSASPRNVAQSGDWIFTGKRQYRGWKFIYREAKLRSITAPSGRSLSFVYSNDRLVRIEQQGAALVELSYDGTRVASAKINGVVTRFQYRNGEVIILPKTTAGELIRTERPRLFTIQTGNLNPIEFAYQNSFLRQIRRGDFVEKFRVETETLEDRLANLRSLDRKSGVKHSGRVAGRLLADAQFQYSYSGSEPGRVKLTNSFNQTAEYDYARNTGIFKIQEFSGKKYTIYYFMRYDVAYLGKVRKIVDGRGRTVVNYRYDKLTGNVIRVRDMAENDLDFSYDALGNLQLISRRASTQDAAEPVTAFRYDDRGNRIGVSTLDAEGKAVVTTAIRYDQNRQPIQIGNGQFQKNIAYNSSGYPIRLRDEFGRVQELRYDKYNRLESVTDHFGVTTHYTYNSSGALIGIERHGDGQLLTLLAISYDGNGRVVGYVDQAGRSKKLERDALGRVVREFFPDESCVEYAYNALGQLASVVDQNANELKFDWSRFGLESKTTAAGQLTDYVYDEYGLLSRVDSREQQQVDRSIAYTYDQYDRVEKVTYGSGETESFQYDAWGRVICATRGERKATMRYDYFGRLVEKREGNLITTYAYNPWGQRISRTTEVDGLKLSEERSYDKFGRLTEIKSGEKSVVYVYNRVNQLERQIVDNVPIEFTYTKYGQLESKILGGRNALISKLEYRYGSDGMVLGRIVDGKYQSYQYDRKGQLLAVRDEKNLPVEEYIYDPAGNILKKTVAGKTTV